MAGDGQGVDPWQVAQRLLTSFSDLRVRQVKLPAGEVALPSVGAGAEGVGCQVCGPSSNNFSCALHCFGFLSALPVHHRGLDDRTLLAPLTRFPLQNSLWNVLLGLEAVPHSCLCFGLIEQMMELQVQSAEEHSQGSYRVEAQHQ